MNIILIILNYFCFKIRTREGCTLSTFLINIEPLGYKRNRHSNWKEVKLCLQVSDLIELINDFSKVAGYKVNTQKSVVFLYTMNNLKRKLQK